ncbi:MAG: hypothetical protein AB8B79_19445 [Granulosicoccus sp.]
MKKKKQVQNSSSLSDRFGRMPVERKRRLVLKSVFALGAFGVAAGALSSYDKKNRELHDLTVIGDGKPVVVQIHDTSCSICRSLKSRAIAALKGQERIEFRIADLASEAGRQLQQKYGVGKTTLLLFNGEGRRINTVQGLQSLEELEMLFERSFPSNTQS